MAKDRLQPGGRLQAELPIPYDGVVLEVFNDLVTDRASFVRGAMENIRQENPYVLELIVRHALVSPYRDLALDWGLSYYEVNSRSAKRQGTQMIKVSKSLVDASLGKQAQEMSLLRIEDREDIIEYFNREEELRKVRINSELERSAEMAKFWTTYHTSLANHLMENVVHEADFPSSIIDILNELLHQQIDANKLTNQFPE